MHGMEVEPTALFAVRNTVFTAIIVALAWLMASYKGLPNVLVVLFVLIAFYALVTSQTVVGRRIYALGGNEKAARLSGIRTSACPSPPRQHGRARRGRRPRRRRSPQRCDAEGGKRLRTRCHRRLLHRRRLGRGVGKVMGRSALVMGGYQRHVHPRHGIDYQQVIRGCAAAQRGRYNKNKA
jgi:putative multiple sugar transport system permease protein